VSAAEAHAVQSPVQTSRIGDLPRGSVVRFSDDSGVTEWRHPAQPLVAVDLWHLPGVLVPADELVELIEDLED
jgi:hypothetical protein